MQKKCQVFVSSTYEDLLEERQEIMQALLELDCIPAGMELFPAADEDQWSLIRGVIDECDYYVVVSAGRYGSTGTEGISYTEMEYRYAVEKGKPVIAFIHKDQDSLPKKKSEQSKAGQKRLADFQAELQTRMCKFWTTPQELGSVVSRSLVKLQRSHPGVGWVRADLVPSQEASLEILELRKQVDSLKAKLEDARTQAPPGTERLAQGKDTFKLHWEVRTAKESEYYDWNGGEDCTWDSIFYTLSPAMIQEATDTELYKLLSDSVEWSILESLEDNNDLRGHSLSKYRINLHDFQTIIVQLRALGLITKSTKTRSVKDKNLYWTLTPYGDSIMNQLRAIARQEDTK